MLFLTGAVTEPAERPDYLDREQEEEDDGEAGEEGDD